MLINIRINITRSEWIVPCTQKKFIEFMNEIQLECTLDKGKMENFKAFELVTQKDNFKIYLNYRSYFLVSSRDF